MKAVTQWSFRPYTEMHRPERGQNPYICRLAPTKDTFTVDMIDNHAPNASHLFFWRKRGVGEFIPVRPERRGEFFTMTIDCDTDTDYEVYAQCEDGKRSSVRLIRTGDVPGIVINYLHPEDEEYSFSGRYLCSPSILKLPDGKILAAMDVFAGDAPQNLTLIYSSSDGGKTWDYLSELFPCFWGRLFLVDRQLYMMGCSREYGDLLIGRSDDGGRTFTNPTVLFRGANHSAWCGLHRAPMAVEISHGRIMTDVQYGAWAKKMFGDMVISASVGSDLLDPSSWVGSELWLPENCPEAQMKGISGGIEGNVVTAPDGRVYDILRYATGKSLMLEFFPDEPERALEFVGFADFPANTSKVDIVYDKKTKLYWSLASYHLDKPATNRNLLSLLCSENLKDWKLVKHIIDYRDSDPKVVGFQYITMYMDGNDIVFQSRTALNCPHNFHDSNYATFHRIENFRTLLK